MMLLSSLLSPLAFDLFATYHSSSKIDPARLHETFSLLQQTLWQGKSDASQIRVPFPHKVL